MVLNKLNKNVINSIYCTGCFSCYNTCKYNAIKMTLNNNGFYTPIIQSNKCTSCKMCLKNCPAINKVSNSNYKTPEVLMTWSLNDFVIKNSTSGGMFYEISKKIIEENGVIITALWNNSKFSHTLIKNQTILDKIISNQKQKTKYFQSWVGYSYKKTKILLENNKNIIFFGLPCQIAAMKKFINYESDKIILVDIICHGVSSFNFFCNYIKYKYKIDLNELDNIDFRNKRNGWQGSFHLKLIKKNKSNINRHYMQDGFYKGFMNNLILNKPCYNCIFSSLPRYGDISIGDFWGAPKKAIKMNKNRGISVLLINNSKGNNFIKKIIDFKRIYYERTDLNNAKLISRIFSGKHSDIQKEKAFQLFNDYNKKSIKEIEKEYLLPDFLIKIIFNKIIKYLKITK